MGRDRHAHRKVLARIPEVAAALVPAPVEQQLEQAHAAPQLRAVLAVGRQQHVLREHRGGDADRDRFLAERGGVGAEPAGALQRDRLVIEGAGAHHRAIERDQLLRIAGERRQGAERAAVGVDETGAGDLEARDRLSHALPSCCVASQ